MRLVPVVANTHINNQGHIQAGAMLHAEGDAFGDGVEVVRVDFEYQLIVHLHDHLCPQAALV